jgi:radial spoke head protein 4A
MSAWTKLPDISPKQIRASRNIKVLFSGDLDRKIYTNPFFDGQEKHYLRAQIARIVHSTTLLPKGVMKPVEDSETREIEENTPEDGPVVFPTTYAMKEPGMWVHGKKGILKNAKTGHSEPE